MNGKRTSAKMKSSMSAATRLAEKTEIRALTEKKVAQERMINKSSVPSPAAPDHRSIVFSITLSTAKPWVDAYFFHKEFTDSAAASETLELPARYSNLG